MKSNSLLKLFVIVFVLSLFAAACAPTTAVPEPAAAPLSRPMEDAAAAPTAVEDSQPANPAPEAEAETVIETAPAAGNGRPEATLAPSLPVGADATAKNSSANSGLLGPKSVTLNSNDSNSNDDNSNDDNSNDSNSNDSNSNDDNSNDDNSNDSNSNDSNSNNDNSNDNDDSVNSNDDNHNDDNSNDDDHNDDNSNDDHHDDDSNHGDDNGNDNDNG